MSDYRDELVKAIRATHGAEATHERTVPVREMFQGKVAWEGEVESFAITGHPKATRAYAWGYQTPPKGWQITTVLAVPPVVTPHDAVKAAIVANARQVAPQQSRKT